MADDEKTPEEVAAEAAAAEAAAAAAAGDGDDGDKDDDKKDYRAELRRYERTSKTRIAAQEKELKKLREEAEARATANQTDQDKAIAEARKSAREEALSEVNKERRSDRLDTAVTRLAAKSFADPEDALTHVERMIRQGKVEADEIFTEDHKVNTDNLKEVLDDLLKDKPHLAAGDRTRPDGSSDAGRGSGSDKDLEAMSSAEHAEAIYGKK